MSIEITDQNFEELVLKSEVPVLIDCRAEKISASDDALTPIMESITAEFAGRAVVAHCDFDCNPGIPAQAGVRTMPMLMYFKDGKLVDKHVGSATKFILAARLNAQL